MKSRLLALIVCLAATSSIGRSQTLTDSVTLSGVQAAVGKYTPNHGAEWYGLSAYSIGRIFPTLDSSALVSRSLFTFDWSSQIPTNATITKVTVTYFTSPGTYTFKITQVSTPGGDQATWMGIGSGSSMATAIAYGSNSFVSANIKTALAGALSQGHFYLGALSENETANNSYAPAMSLSLSVVYTHQAQALSFQARNDMHGYHGGTIGVGRGGPDTSRTSPFDFGSLERQTLNFRAFDNQAYTGYSWVFNDVEAPNTKSSWTLRVGPRETGKGSSQSISYVAQVADNGGIFTAYLQNLCNVTQYDQTEFDGAQSHGVVATVVEGNNATVTAASTKTVNGHAYNFAGWSDGSSANPRTLTPLAHVTVNALYKSIHSSNDPGAFSANSQRRLIETNCSGTAWLHQVYTSSINGVLHVWLEHSSNGGSSWVLGNNGQPLDGSAGGKCPSIALTRDAEMNMNYIGVVWQQPSGGTYQIRGKMFNQSAATSMIPSPVSETWGAVYTEGSDSYSVNANPNLLLAEGIAAPTGHHHYRDQSRFVSASATTALFLAASKCTTHEEEMATPARLDSCSKPHG